MSECYECKLVAMGKGRSAMCYDCLEERNVELKAELAELRATASPFAECLYLDEITSEERAALAVLLLQEKGE